MIGPAKAARTGSFVLPVLALAGLLLFSGCGGGDDSSTATQATTSTAEAEKDSGASKQGSGEQGTEQGGKEESNGSSSGGGNASQPEGEREPGISPQQKQEVTTANIALESPAIKRGGAALSSTALPAKYTCDGKNIWPTLRWKGLPAEAEELILLVLSVPSGAQKLLFDWAVAGLDPSLSEIEEGKLPDGAIVGENSFGKNAYNLCPAKGQSEETYVFLLFAIPEALDPAPGFDAKELRQEALDEHGNVGVLSATYEG